ncbi:MAG TPA: cysteine desulfurase family protein [Caldisericia bacterium]|nr:cysteine desulfurase family protein [Caldisericia bacterium]
MERIYFDHAATTPVRKEVLEAMIPYFSDKFGNASSLYYEGVDASEAVEEARNSVAKLIGADESEIYFTSSGTESDNMAIKGVALALRDKGKHIIVSSIEHHAVLNAALSLRKLGYEITILPVDGKGFVNPDDVKKNIKNDTILVSIMLANNEIGTIEPIEEVSKITKERGVYLHTDAVQAVGNYPVNVDSLGCDLLSLSAHKFYGPKGVGAIYIRKGSRIMPLMDGGGHEKGKRSGTYNTPGIVGLGKASVLAISELESRINQTTKLRDKIIDGIISEIPYIILNGDREKRLPGNANFSIKYIEGESLILSLDAEGFAVSTGSACSSHSLKISHVLNAIGLDPVDAQGSLRVTVGLDNTEEEVDKFLEILPKVVLKLRRMSPLYKE